MGANTVDDYSVHATVNYTYVLLRFHVISLVSREKPSRNLDLAS